jgi:hypothetical protein
MDHLPKLCMALADDAFDDVRYDYWRTLCELFVENYSERTGQWCRRHGLAFTGHYSSEEHLGKQVRILGAAMPHYEHMDWPGIDILCDQADELITVKQCTSVADQLGKPWALSELYGCTGWDWPLEGQKAVADWQFACGITMRCPHLVHHTLAGQAKRDYPPSLGDRNPWWPLAPGAETYFARLSYMLTRGRPLVDAAVIHPVESAWGAMRLNRKNGAIVPEELEATLTALITALTRAHHDWHFVDESLLAAHGGVEHGRLRLGHMTYGAVILPSLLTLRASTVRLLADFMRGGGRLLAAGRRPDRVDGRPGAETLTALLDGARTAAPDTVVRELDRALPRRVSITADGAECGHVWCRLLKTGDGRILFVQSHDRRNETAAAIEVEGAEPVTAWDPLSGKRTRVQALSAGGRLRFDCVLPPSGSALFTLGLDVPGAEPPGGAAGRLRSGHTVDGPYSVELTESNTLPLDVARVRLDGAAWSDPMPVAGLTARLRGAHGLDALQQGFQPWYLRRAGLIDDRPRGRLEMAFAFHVSTLPGRCLLGIETPGQFAVTVNDAAAGPENGYWLDESIRTLDIGARLVEGMNRVVLSTPYRTGLVIEPLYLVGAFGVRRLDTQQEWTSSNRTLTAAPVTLTVGDWIEQALPFYTGRVRYRLSSTAVDAALDRRPPGSRVWLTLPGLRATAALLEVNGKRLELPWPPFSAEITDALRPEGNALVVDLAGGRRNTLGPLHTPWQRATTPEHFSPSHPDWTDGYQLTRHGLTVPPVLEFYG